MDVKKELLEFISTSTVLRENLSLKDHMKLYSHVNQATEGQVFKLYKTLIIEEVKPPKTNPKAEAILKKGLTAASLVVPIPGLTLAIGYLVEVNRYKCAYKVEKSKSENKIVDYHRCRVIASSYGVKYIQNEINKCTKTENEKKCQKKLWKLLIDWKKRLVREEGKLRWAEAKARESKMRGRHKAERDRHIAR
ncbi:hypothetical protein KAR91_06615 [Candidatus Pacearchaeota archaeon]|nr:hypothetical protein [Candidatus Pacearchaeota archaeon]